MVFKHAPSLVPRVLRTVPLCASLTVILPSSVVLAHDSWISRYRYRDPATNAWCCDEHDCSAIDRSEVKVAGPGFLVRGIYWVERQRILPSGDGNYWACFNSEGTGPHDQPAGVRCLFVPFDA